MYKIIIELTEKETKKESVIKQRNYITKNWDGNRESKRARIYIGCSAEGHVSHILSSRLSARPMGDGPNWGC